MRNVRFAFISLLIASALLCGAGAWGQNSPWNGFWQSGMTLSTGLEPVYMQFNVQGNTFTGAWWFIGHSQPIHGDIDGNHITFIEHGDQIAGTLEGDRLTLNLTSNTAKNVPLLRVGEWPKNPMLGTWAFSDPSGKPGLNRLTLEGGPSNSITGTYAKADNSRNAIHNAKVEGGTLSFETGDPSQGGSSSWTATMGSDDHLLISIVVHKPMAPGVRADHMPVDAVDGTKMGYYRAMARLIMASMKRGDYEDARTLAACLEHFWDRTEGDFAKKTPMVYGQIDHAMDLFIFPIMHQPPDMAVVEKAYHNYLAQLSTAQ